MEGGLVVKDVTQSSQQEETFTLRPRGLDTLPTYCNKATKTFKTSSGLTFSIGIIKIQGVHSLKLTISGFIPRKHAGNAGKTLV